LSICMSQQQRLPQGLHDVELQKRIVDEVTNAVHNYLARVRNVVDRLHKIMNMSMEMVKQHVISEIQKKNIPAREEDIAKLVRMQGMSLYFNTISTVESYLLWMYEDLVELRKHLTSLMDMFRSMAPQGDRERQALIDRLRQLHDEVGRVAIELIKLSHYVTDMYVYDMKPVIEIYRLIKTDTPETAVKWLDYILTGRFPK